MSLTDWHRGRIDQIMIGQGGDFTSLLLRLIRKADRENRDKLRRAFPEEVELVEAWEKSWITPANAG